MMLKFATGSKNVRIYIRVSEPGDFSSIHRPSRNFNRWLPWL
jgi:hypothetical protein